MYIYNRDIRDQGFTRPKVLILLPYRNTALDVMELMIKMSGSKQIVCLFLYIYINIYINIYI